MSQRQDEEQQRLPVLKTSSNYCDWTYDVQNYFYAREWDEIFTWMTGKPCSDEHPQARAAAPPPVVEAPVIPAPAAIPRVGGRFRPRRGVAARRHDSPILPVVPDPAVAPAVPALELPRPAVIPPRPSTPPRPLLPGTPSTRRKAWGVMTIAIGKDVRERMDVSPNTGNLPLLWKAVQDCFFRSTAISKNVIKARINALTCTSAGSPQKFIAALKDCFEMLARAGEPPSDSEKIYQFLRGIPTEYAPFKTTTDAIESTGVVQTFENIVKSFQTYLQRGGTWEASTSESQTTMFSNGSNGHQIRPAAPKSKAACRNFKAGTCKMGDRCRYSHDPSAPETTYRPERRPCDRFARGQCKRGTNCRYAHTQPHTRPATAKTNLLTIEVEDDEESANYAMCYLACKTKDPGQKDEWCFDGGSTIHITNSLTGHVPGSLREKKTTVRLANQQIVSCSQTADFSIALRLPDNTTSRIKLLDVVLMLEAPCRLISESRLTSAGLTIIKAEGTCIVYTSSDNTIIMTGSIGSTRGLYFLTTEMTKPDIIPASISWLSKPKNSTEPKTPKTLMKHLEPTGQEAKFEETALAQSYSQGISHLTLHHLRTLHRNYEDCSAMIGAPRPQKPIFCQACVEGKSHARPVSDMPSSLRAPRRGWMLHCDLFGPIAVETPSGKRHAAIFIDDFSRYVFVFLLRLKSEFFDCFVFLAQAIENETDSKLAFLKTDGDGIFRKCEKLAAYCKAKGIRHLFSTPYCPSENGRPERVIRTLVEMACTSMIHGCAPRNLWGEAVCQAGYVYNRIPHSALPAQFTCPLSAWRSTDRKPDQRPSSTLHPSIREDTRPSCQV